MVSDVLESTRIEEPHLTETMENFEGVPMLEICERPVVWTGEVTPSMFQAYKGWSLSLPSTQIQPPEGTTRHSLF